MNVRYWVALSQAEREQLSEMLRGGHHAARKLKRAQILLAADSGATDTAIATSVAVGESTVYRNQAALRPEQPRAGR
jgi:Homeodomain-like domain